MPLDDLFACGTPRVGSLTSWSRVCAVVEQKSDKEALRRA